MLSRVRPLPVSIANISVSIAGVQIVLGSTCAAPRNKLAHLLTKHAEGIYSFVIWIEKNPSIIESRMIHDAMYFSSSK